MRVATLALALSALCPAVLAAEETYLDVESIYKPGPADCTVKTKAGDKIAVHYRGTLAKDGSEFDASYNRGQPLEFTLGSGMVIKGWDQGLLDMCAGEKRKLTIQPEWAYGSRAVGPIPKDSTLIFEAELITINGEGKKDEL